ncbi:MAG: diaminopimelate decarboxylase [Rhodothermales bacterium]
MRSHPSSWVVLLFREHNADDLYVRAEAVRAARAEGHGVVCLASPARSMQTGEEEARALEQALGEAVVWHGAGAAFDIERWKGTDAAVHVIGGEGTADEGDGSVAAMLAARLDAARLEVWGALPGLCTADPDLVPSARLLRHLGYADALALAVAGVSDLAPAALSTARAARLPIRFRSTARPEAEGTTVSHAAPDVGVGVLALIMQPETTLVTVAAPEHAPSARFLAEVFAAFARHGLAATLSVQAGAHIALVCDAGAYGEVAGALLADLGALGEVVVRDGCATVRLVGRRLDAGLPDVAAAVDVLDGHPVHLVGRSDGGLAVVVDAGQAERVTRELHAALFGAVSEGAVFGPTLGDVMGRSEQVPGRGVWWRERRGDLLALAERGTPRYAYDAATMRSAARTLLALEPVDRVLYALKANPHPGVLRVLRDAGVAFECVSLAEVERVFDLFPDHAPERVLFTPNFAPRAEYERAFALGVTVTVDNAFVLDAWPDVFAGRTAFVRVDPGEGRGHHAHVRTAGTRSKFGVGGDGVEAVAARAADLGLRVVGLHAHLGSGITDTATWAETADALAGYLPLFPDVRVLDLGGGLGVPTLPTEPVFDVAAAAEPLAAFKAAHPGLALWLEPGRFLVAEAGVLLARVTQLKEKAGVRFVGVDAGMNALVRPTLYGAYHEIVNLSRLDAEPAWTAEVVGPICESGDVLGHARRLPVTAEGDVVLVATAGAYGRAMASTYNLRPLPEEVVLERVDY